jgi:4-aminobutyrate aminotransferase-like enzyme
VKIAFEAGAAVKAGDVLVQLDTSTEEAQLQAAEATAALAKACHQEGLLVLTCGTYGNVLRFLPPLVIGEDLLGEGLDIIEQAFARI